MLENVPEQTEEDHIHFEQDQAMQNPRPDPPIRGKSSHHRRPTPYHVPHQPEERRATNLVTRPGILNGHEHSDRWQGQFLEPRFRNGIVRDATMAFADFQGSLLFLLIAFFGSGAHASVNEVAVAYGMGLMATVFCHASSQANPSISMIQAFLGKLSARQASFNIIAQITAAITASGIQTWATGHTQSIATLQQVNAPQALLIETVMSTILYTVVLWASAVANVQQHIMPFIIALVFYGLEVCSIPYTSGSLNIARWLGPAIVSGTWPSHSWVWATGPLLAVPLSIGIFKGNQALQQPSTSTPDQTHVGPGQIIELDEDNHRGEHDHVGLPRARQDV